MLFGRKNRKPIIIPSKKVKEWKYTTCNYCSTGCSIEIGLNEDKKIVTTRGHAGADVNRGKLCIKGILEHELFDSPGRGTEPLIREQHFEKLKIHTPEKIAVEAELDNNGNLILTPLMGQATSHDDIQKVLGQIMAPNANTLMINIRAQRR